MKKLLLLGLLAASLAMPAAAEEVTVTGNDFTVESSSLTGVPEGWNLLKMGGGGSWTYYSSLGDIETSASSYGSNNTIIITPQIMGNLQIKWCAKYDDSGWGWGDDDQYGSSGNVYIFKMKYNEETQAWEKESTSYLKSENSWSTDSGSATTNYDTGYSGGYYGIAFTTAGFHSITYTAYDPNVEVKSMQITSANLAVSGSDKLSESEAGADIPYSVKVNVTNNGTVALNPGDEGYTFSLMAASSNTLTDTNGAPIATWTPTESLAVGESKEFVMSGTYKIQDLIDAGVEKSSSYGYYRFALHAKENVTGNSKYVYWMEVYPYEMFYKVYCSGDNLAVKGLNFGVVSEDATTNGSKHIYIQNSGAVPLAVTGIELPAGFICDQDFTNFVVGPVTAASDERTKYLDIKVDPAASGILTGTAKFIITGDENPVTFNLTAKKVAPGMWLETFENGSAPSGWILNGAAVSELSYSWTISGTSSDVLTSSTRYSLEEEANASYGITPKLRAAEGDIMAIEARTQNYNYDDAWINIYSSPDRENWTLVSRIRKYNIEDADLHFPENNKMAEYTFPMTAGDNYYKFVLSYAQIDNLMGGERVAVAHDMAIIGTTLPAAAKVNNVYNGTVRVRNINTAAEAAGTYAVNLLEDGEIVATVTETPEIAAGAEVTIPVSYTPHNAGVRNLSANVVFDDLTMSSDPVEINVAEESFDGKAIVGEGSLMSTASGNNVAPGNFYNKKNLVSQLYTQEQLSAAGILPGTVITGISYMGYNAETSKELKGTVKYWITSTEFTELAKTDVIETPDEAMVANISDYEIQRIGTADSPVEVISIPFDQPYTYTGGNIIVTDLFDLPNWTSRVYLFVNTAIKNQTIIRSDDCNSGTIEAKDPKDPKGFTQTIFSYQAEPTYMQGTVTEAPAQARAAGDAIEGALVTLTSGDVIYSGTSDAEGHYQIPVVQTDKEYNVKVTKEGYLDYEEEAPVSFAGGNVDLNIQLVKDTVSGIGSVEAESVNVSIRGNVITVAGAEDAQLAVFALNGMEVARAQGNTISTANLANGVYVLRVESAQGSASVRFVKR